MGSIITCFLLTPVKEAEAFLRRYARNDTLCSTRYGYHNAEVSIGRHPWEPPEEDLFGYPGEVPHDDPRWPKACPCGYVFTPEDHWQVNIRRLHQRSDNGGLTTLSNAPPGAMWYADWYPVEMKGPDGHALVVRTPDGDWLVDGPASNSPKKQGWQRSGVPPKVTAQPSILMSCYHGWLRDGVLVEC